MLTGYAASYADFVVLSNLQYFKRIDESLFKRMLKIEPALETLYEAGKQWVERDDRWIGRDIRGGYLPYSSGDLKMPK